MSSFFQAFAVSLGKRLCRSTLVTLDLSCRLTIFLIERRIPSMVMVFSLKSNTAPISCKVCVPIIRSYKGAVAPASYSTMSGILEVH